MTRYGFRKVPHASEHEFSAMAGITEKAFKFKYRGEVVQPFASVDMMFNVQASLPVLDNFFGFGNTTELDESEHVSYYRVRYQFAEADILLRKRYFNKLSVMAGPALYHYWNDFNDNRDYILGKPSNDGLDSSTVYSTKTYAGLKAAVELDNLNSNLFPTRGIRWVNKLTMYRPLSDYGKQVNKFESDMTIYASLKIPARVVGVIKMGGGHMFNDSVDYFQALSLGQNNVLRGFRKNRFTGTSTIYGSLEFRIKLFDSKSYILPGQVGLLVFNDIGRVWYVGEVSRKWHYDAGGGVYYNPFNLVIMSATVAYSKEEHVFNFSLGTKFNITY